jgi:hypothetical protein
MPKGSDELLDAPFRALLRSLAEDAQAQSEPWFLPEAWAHWEATGDPTGLIALGVNPTSDRAPWKVGA